MKKTLLIIVWLLSGVYCYAQDLKMEDILEENCLPKGKLNGNIEQIQRVHYRYNHRWTENDTLTHNDIFYRIFFFDTNNKVVKIKNYDENHRRRIVTKCYYNKKGLLVKVRDKHCPKIDHHDWKMDHDYCYDDSNRIKKEIFLRRFTDNYIYDENGRLVKMVSCDKKEIDEVNTYKYNDKGQKIEECVMNDTETMLKKKIVYSYDANGYEIEVRTFNSKDQLMQAEVYKYDAKGNKTECIEYDQSNKIRNRFERTYDVKGNEIEGKKYDSDNKLKSQWRYWYDLHNNIYKEEYYEYYKDGDCSLEENLYLIKYRK